MVKMAKKKEHLTSQHFCLLFISNNNTWKVELVIVKPVVYLKFEGQTI